MSEIYGDRRQTGKLLESLREVAAGVDERDEIADELGRTEDPRAVAPLRRLLEDRGQPTALREASGRALRAIELDVDEPTLLGWWNSGDEVLQAHALSLMDDVAGAEVVLCVARDPTHPLHGQAIRSMSFGFWRPEHQRLKMAALNDRRPEVREAAASALLMDEPIAAESTLIRCLEDPSLGVVHEASCALEYYPSVAVVKALAARIMRGPPAFDEESRETATTEWQQVLTTWDAVRDEIRTALVREPAAVAEALREWLEPAWAELGFKPNELEPAPRERGEPAPKTPLRALAFETAMRLFEDPDTAVSSLHGVADVDVAAYRDDERARLYSVLETSDDWVRRDLLTRFCAATGDSERLLRLLGDKSFLVRKSAMYHLSCLPPDEELARHILEHFARSDVRGTHASETLGAYVRHAPTDEGRRLLSIVALDSSRDEGQRYHAVYALSEAGAVSELIRLFPLLEEPPQVTWAIHNALFEAARKHSLTASPNALDALSSVDNLHLRTALAGYRHALGA